jgi:hypothetical protein
MCIENLNFKLAQEKMIGTLFSIAISSMVPPRGAFSATCAADSARRDRIENSASGLTPTWIRIPATLAAAVAAVVAAAAAVEAKFSCED